MRMPVVHVLVLAGLALPFSSSLFADALSIEGGALDCETSIKTVTDSLGEVKGVSDVVADADLGQITVNVTTEASANNALEALAKVGLHGAVKHKSKSVAFPASGAKRGMKLSSFALSGPYLGCNASVTRLQKALQTVKGVETVEIDRVDRSVRLSGKEIEVLAAVEAINKAGFHVTFQQEPVRKKVK
jgi:copper chaperone CopZ